MPRPFQDPLPKILPDSVKQSLSIPKLKECKNVSLSTISHLHVLGYIKLTWGGLMDVLRLEQVQFLSS